MKIPFEPYCSKISQPVVKVEMRSIIIPVVDQALGRFNFQYSRAYGHKRAIKRMAIEGNELIIMGRRFPKMLQNLFLVETRHILRILVLCFFYIFPRLKINRAFISIGG